MTTDWTEPIRRVEVAAINTVVQIAGDDARALLEEHYGKDNVWNTDEVTEAFRIEGFMAPYVAVTRKADGARGSLQFSHSPRYYFGFVPA